MEAQEGESTIVSEKITHYEVLEEIGEGDMNKQNWGWLLLVGMAKGLFFLAAIPGAAIFTLALFGVGSSAEELVIPLGWLPRIGPFLMVVLIFGVNLRVSHRMLEGIKKEFYSGSITAKKERAFRVFYRHWSKGVGAIRDNPKPGLLLGRWDLETMSLIRRFCLPHVVESYLRNTHRSSSGEDTILDVANKDDSVNFLRNELLDSDFEDIDKQSLLLPG